MWKPSSEMVPLPPPSTIKSLQRFKHSEPAWMQFQWNSFRIVKKSGPRYLWGEIIISCNQSQANRRGRRLFFYCEKHHDPPNGTKSVYWTGMDQDSIFILFYSFSCTHTRLCLKEICFSTSGDWLSWIYLNLSADVRSHVVTALVRTVSRYM